MTLGLVTFEAIVISILEGMVIMNHLGLVQNCSTTIVEEGVSESDLIYHALFIISQVFQVVLCIDALYQRNTGIVQMGFLFCITYSFCSSTVCADPFWITCCCVSRVN
ncbi:hypothetical protein RMCBS344292_13801 [Rhizopus microsporus]|nr:hypothetical protein RMCBS344292_13801 [Rhizopus microsporus]